MKRKRLHCTSTQTLQLLNAQLAVSAVYSASAYDAFHPNNPFNPGDPAAGGTTVTLSFNSMSEALQKIVWNTAATVFNLETLINHGVAIYKPFFASGGLVSGPGTGTSDSVSAQLSNGEYVMNAAAVNLRGVSFFDALNAGRLPAANENAIVLAPQTSSGFDTGAMVAELRSLRKEVEALRKDNNRGHEGSARIAAKAAEHIGAVIEVTVGEAAKDLVREQRYARLRPDAAGAR